MAGVSTKAPQPYGLKQPLDFVVLSPSHPLASLQNKNMPDHKPQRWKARDEIVCCPRGVRSVVAVGRERGQARVLLAWGGAVSEALAVHHPRVSDGTPKSPA